jgi:hypothetical protein
MWNLISPVGSANAVVDFTKVRMEEHTMATVGKTIRIGVTAALLLAGTTTMTQGQVVGSESGPEVGPGGDWAIQLREKMVCTQCSLAEVQKLQPNNSQLFQLTYRQEQGVMEVSWVSNTRWWNHLTVPRLRIRGEASLVQKLTAEENLSKEVEVSGVLNSSQILDLHAVTIRG